MKSAGASINGEASGAIDSKEAEFVETVRRELTVVASTTPSEDDAAILVRKSLDMLDAVKQLLRSLSPTEIQATASHVYLRRLDGHHDVLWTVYGRRHQVLVEVFASQHASFGGLARAFLERRGLPVPSTRSTLDPSPPKRSP